MDYAQLGVIDLAIPEFSLCEAEGTIAKNYKNRENIIQYIEAQLNSFKGLKRHEKAIGKIKDRLKEIRENTKIEEKELSGLLEEIREKIKVIPYTGKIYIRAHKRHLSNKAPFSIEDCCVIESIFDFIGKKGSKYDKIVFYTQNTEDFDDPDLIEECKDKGIHIRFELGQCVGIIESYEQRESYAFASSMKLPAIEMEKLRKVLESGFSNRMEELATLTKNWAVSESILSKIAKENMKLFELPISNLQEVNRIMKSCFLPKIPYTFDWTLLTKPKKEEKKKEKSD